MKKLVIAFLTIIFILPTEIFASEKYHQSGIVIYVNNKKFTQEDIIVRNNRVLVKYDCGIFETLGYTTNYDIVSKEVIIKDGKDIATTFLNEYVIYRNGIASYTSDVRSDVVDRHVYIPLRAFIESINGNIDWNDKAREIYITTLSE